MVNLRFADEAACITVAAPLVFTAVADFDYRDTGLATFDSAPCRHPHCRIQLYGKDANETGN
jgi:hypothetical protein